MHAVTDPGADRRLGPITIGLLALRLGVLMIVLQIGSARPLADDLSRFHEIYTTPGTPYRTFPVEYAPGEVLFIEGVGSADTRTLAQRLAIVAFLADIATWAAIGYGWGRRAAERYLWIGTPLLIFLYTRFDLVPVALAAWGASLATRGAERSGGSSFATAILTKVWPIVLLPAFVVSGRRRATAWAASMLVVGVAGWLVFAGKENVLEVLTFRHAQGWGVESIVGVWVWIVTGGPVRLESGAPRVGIAPGWATAALSLLLLVTLAAIWFLASRRGRGAFGAAAVAAIGALITCSPLFSLQYAAWLLPWGAVAWADGDRRYAAIIAGISVLTAILFMVYQPDRAGLSQILLVCRNALVIGLPIVWLLPERSPALHPA